MNITAGKYIILLYVFSFVMIFNTNISTGNPVSDSTFKIILEISGGYMAPLDSNISNGGFTPSLRLMWEPDHKLNIGIETAKMLIEKHTVEEKEYDAGKSDMKVSLKAIPVLFVVNMEIWELDFYGGMGASYVWTDLEAFDSHVTSYEWNYSLMFSAGYTYMFNDWIGIGAEAKTYIFTKLNKQVGSLELKLKFGLLEW